MIHKIAVIGLGYVGLPLAVEFSKKYKVVGYDINNLRVKQLHKGIDTLNQLDFSDLKKSVRKVKFTDNPDLLSDCNTFIITVPTPGTSDKKPDLSFLINATKTVGCYLKKGDIIICDAVYPGCTEEHCVPVLEQTSDLNSCRFLLWLFSRTYKSW